MILCPCGTGLAYGACCGPRLKGLAPAPTAEALMRSRYVAFVRRDAAYLLRTWHAEHRPASVEFDDAKWLELQVLEATAGAESDTAGTVSFVATYLDDAGRTRQLHERSRFVRGADGWVYVDGDTDWR